MGRFRQKKSGGIPKISTASLPDIMFILLCFFMVSTTMRETNLIVKIRLPAATEVQKLERKNLVSFIYVGQPIKGTYGTESRIQLNDQFATVQDIQGFVAVEREARNEADRRLMTTSIKADRDTRMGIISDIKQELRKAGAFKINYSSRKAAKIR
ncbi:MAG: biopolymer transporter ExbD [Bacteroidales bacterium]|nr:biopolymer transporter ExbD [Bacteroidales bacterium]